MIKDGTRVVAGVTPGKGGQTLDDVPVYHSVADAKREHRIDATIIFVPPKFASGAVTEAAQSDIPLIITITEGIPVLAMLEAYHMVKERGLRMIGPNCPGLISPGKCKIGIMPWHIHLPGGIGVISRSGTLTYEVVYNLTKHELGQSTCIGIGGDPIIGTNYIDALTLFQADPDTTGIVVIGEIGGDDEEAAARYIEQHVSKPVVGFISGRTAPPGKRMGHAGAIISGSSGTPEAKVKAFQDAGVEVADKPDEIPALLKKRL